MFFFAFVAFEQYSRLNYNEFCSKLDSLNKRQVENGAASVIRTRDLTLTKGALYRWSYSSTCSFDTLRCRYMQASTMPNLFLLEVVFKMPQPRKS